MCALKYFLYFENRVSNFAVTAQQIDRARIMQGNFQSQFAR